MMTPLCNIRKVLLLPALLIVMCGIVSAAAVTPSFTYQGKLTNAAGTPLTGTYTVTFKLYDASTNGTTLSTDTHSVTATNGLFTTSIAVTDPKKVDGRALWLGIKVGSDTEMTPRQEIRPVPYALSLRPGAVVKSPVFMTDTGGSLAAPHPAVNIFTTFDYNPGINITASGHGSHGVNAFTSGDDSAGLFTHTEGSNSVGVYAYATGLGSPAIWGESAQSVGVKGIGKTGGSFTTNAGGSDWNHLARAVDVSTTFDYNPGIDIMTSGSGSQGVRAVTTGYDSAAVRSETTGDHSSGAALITWGRNSIGLMSVTHGDTANAADLETEGPNSIALDAVTYGKNSHGIRSITIGPDSPGIRSDTQGSNSPGILLSTQGSNSTGLDVRSEGDASLGIYVQTTKNNSPGILSGTYGLNSRGLYAVTLGDTSPGMVAHTFRNYSEGVYSVTDGVYSHGVYVKAQGSSSQGVNASSAQATAVWADTGRADHMYGVQTPDYMRAARYDTGSSDVAEYWPVTGDVTPGTVLVLGDGGILHESTQAYDTRVAGIVSTEPGISLGTRDGGNPGEQLIALAGRVPCRVDASSAPIQSGDLLTTSDNPGHAMKAEPTLINGRGFYPDGTILGKAAGSLGSGTGTIDVLVTLQ